VQRLYIVCYGHKNSREFDDDYYATTKF